MGLTLTSNIAYEQMAALFDLILCAFLVFDFADEREESNRYFNSLLYLVTVANATEILAVILTSPDVHIPVIIQMLIMSVDYFLNAMVAYQFFCYTKASAPKDAGIISYFAAINRTLLALDIFMLLANMFLQNAFYFDDHGVYQHGPYYLLVGFMFPTIFFISSIITFFHGYRKMSKRQSTAILLMLILNLIGLIIQGYTHGSLLVALPFASLGMYALYFTFESPDYRNLRDTLEKLEEAKANAEEANNAKDTFITQISHEIRTPMNSIMGLTDMILQEMDGRDQLPPNTFPKVHQYVHNIANSGHQLIYIVDNIQNFIVTASYDDGSSYAPAGEVPVQDSAAMELAAPDAHFLLVDDNEMNLFVAKNFLAKTGAKVTTCTGGLECLRALTEEKYDMIFLDYMMPDMDGLEIMDRSHKLVGNLNADTPYIMLTANTVAGTESRAREAGFADYISKPVNWDKFSTVLISHLPKNKLTVHLADGTYQIQTPSESVAPMELFDTASGMEYCLNDADFYRETLNVFTEESAGKMQEIRDYREGEDWKLFTVRVHGLKSTARTIGAVLLSEQAKKMEDAGHHIQDGDGVDEAKVYVDTHLTELLELYGKTVAAIPQLKL